MKINLKDEAKESNKTELESQPLTHENTHEDPHASTRPVGFASCSCVTSSQQGIVCVKLIGYVIMNFISLTVSKICIFKISLSNGLQYKSVGLFEVHSCMQSPCGLQQIHNHFLSCCIIRQEIYLGPGR